MVAVVDNPPKILVVDDDYSILELYRLIFGLPDDESDLSDSLMEVFELMEEDDNEGEATEPQYDVNLLSQGLDAVREVRRASEAGTPYSHALIDMRMPPGIDGLETAKHLREIDPTINITFVTAYADYEEEQLGESLPEGYRMIRKPFSQDEILALFA
ncbi:MAG: response regulator [Gammaproteobacteria bacterium]|jgi:CheY-like chemotaxis protein|nr:response regulator [Gammaproteobacteria bacterium]MBT7307941.1 response regulator [Gammaproteobacteria bacterium]